MSSEKKRDTEPRVDGDCVDGAALIDECENTPSPNPFYRGKRVRPEATMHHVQV